MKRKWIRHLSCLLCLLFAAGIGLLAKMSPTWAEGSTGTAGITYRPKNTAAALGSEANPFTILEIVPNKSMGTFGYMIPGCEPVDMTKVFADQSFSGDVPVDLVEPGFFREKEDKTGYVNADSLILNTFDDASSYEGFQSQVITVTPDQLTDENLEIIKDADLIAITARRECVKYWEKYNWAGETLTEQQRNTTTFYGADGNDLSWNATLAIVERMASNRPAAMFLESTRMWEGSSARYNISKLYLMLMQYGASTFWDKFVLDEAHFKAEIVNIDGGEFLTGTYWNEEMGQTDVETQWDTQTFLTKEGISVMHESEVIPGGKEVFETIVTYDGDESGFKGYLRPGQITPVGGNENENYKPGSNQELFDYYEQRTGKRPDSLSMAEAVYYIMQNMRNSQKEIVKLNVLEISPCSEFIYGSEGWEAAYKGMLPGFSGDLNEDLTVTTMPIYAFIGDITDLNSEYDMIIFNAKQDASNGAKGYNDAAMMSGGPGNEAAETRKSQIYSSVGDLVTTKGGYWSGGGSEIWNTKGIVSASGSDAYQLGARYSGNDLTKKKYEELRDFLAAGRPIIMPQELYRENGDKFEMNPELVDAGSYLYQLGKLVYRPGENESTLFRYGSYKDAEGNNQLAAILAQKNCKLSFPEDGSGVPTPYGAEVSDGYAYVKDAGGNVTDSVAVSGLIRSEQYNETKDEDGNPELRYKFSITGAADAVYGVRLFLDRNGDGVYNGSIKEMKELAAAGQIVSAVGTEEVPVFRIVDMTEEGSYDVTDGNLLAGHKYAIACRVPENERGILPWKLEIYNRDNDSIRSCVTGYTAVRAADEQREQINVLQMNLMPDMRENSSAYVNFADQTTVTGAKFAAYLAAVPDFNVQLSYLENSDWYDLYGEEGAYAKQNNVPKEELIRRWEDYLEDVDMLIIGFADMACFTSDEVFYTGFLNFVNEGKSVILSHDLVSDATFFYREPQSVTDYGSDLRTLAGQRRKYYVQGTNYYRYNRAVRNREADQTQGDDTLNFILDKRKFSMYWDQMFFNQMWGEDEFRHYYSAVKTNIPETVQESYTLDAGTYEKDGAVWRMDYGSEFMDNSVRLLMTYGEGEAHCDRILHGEQKYIWPDTVLTDWIGIANDGQITNYPYMLGDMIQISPTHAQNFQLDLEQDNDGDVTVWYNMTDAHDNGVYSSRSGDVRNNYYMYTKGNITYTGLGHTKERQVDGSVVPLTDDEVKLFVNTMISAYRVVPDKPNIEVTNEDASLYDSTYTMYVMLTGAEKGVDTLDVNFVVRQEGLTDALLPGAETHYYLQYRDADGNVLTEPPATTVTDGVSRLEWNAERASYEVSRNGAYSFPILYQKVLDEGEDVYYLEICAEHKLGNKTLALQKTIKVVVYAMPLFTLH